MRCVFITAGFLSLTFLQNSEAFGVTKIVKDILTDSNHTSLASLLEAIAACRTRARNETSEASSKRRKVCQVIFVSHGRP